MDDGVTLTQAKFGWTKYGGARHGLVKHSGDWFCQACGSNNPDSLPAYMFTADDGAFREFIRICAVCENRVKKQEIKTMKVLFKVTRLIRD